jgi:2Fe-2S ferredoxin
MYRYYFFCISTKKNKNETKHWVISSIFAKILERAMYSIKINFEQKGLEPVTLNDIKPDHSLLEVLLDNGMELHHNCGGVCACSTCHIYIKNGGEFLQELSDKEEDFIDRAVSPRIESRLGCQCELLAGSGEIEILVPDQTQFLGE